MNKNTYTLVITFMILIVVLAFVVKAKSVENEEKTGMKETSIEAVEVVLEETAYVAFEQFQEREQTAFEAFKAKEIKDFEALQTRTLNDFEAFKTAELSSFEVSKQSN